MKRLTAFYSGGVMSYRAICMCGSSASADKPVDVREWIVEHEQRCVMAAWKAVSLEARRW